jgi:O-antigen/teichoic acid export membrane protein
MRLISALIVLIASPIVAGFFNYPLPVKKGIIIAAASFIFSSGYQVLNGIFQKNLAMDKVSLGELVGKVISVIIVILAVKMDLGFSWIIGSLFFNMLVIFIIVFLFSKKYLRFRLRFDFDYWKIFLKESLPIGIGSAIVFVYFKVDTIFLSVMKTSSDVGIYNAAYKVLENLTFFPAMIVGLILPIMANTIFSDKAKFKDVSNKTFKLFVLMTIPLIVGTFFLADDVIRLIGGGQFMDSANVLRILVFAITSIFFSSFFINILIAGNLQKRLIWIYSFAAVFNVLANLWLIPRFSYMAAAYISVLTELLVAVVSFAVVVKKIKYFPSLGKKKGILFAGVMMALFLALFKNINFLVLALGSTAVYFFTLWIFEVVKTEEITSLITKEGVKKYEYDGLP